MSTGLGPNRVTLRRARLGMALAALALLLPAILPATARAALMDGWALTAMQQARAASVASRPRAATWPAWPHLATMTSAKDRYGSNSAD